MEESQLQVLARVRALVVLTFLGAAAFGILAPILPILLTEYFAREEDHGAPIDCSADPHSQVCIDGSKKAAWVSSVVSAVGSLSLIFMSPIIGRASDVYGRKMFLVTSQALGMGIPFSIIYFMQPGGSIVPYFALKLVTSAFGVEGVANASAADQVTPSRRAAAFGYIFVGAVVGFCTASFVSPFFTRTQSLQSAIGLMVAQLVWVTVFLRETLTPDSREQSSTSGFGNPLASFAILWRSKLFMGLTTLIALSNFASTGLGTIQFFFLNVVLGFDAKELARLLLLAGIAGILTQGVLLQPLVNCLREKGVISVAFFASMACSTAMVFIAGFYPHKWLVFALIPVSSLSNLSFSAIAALKSTNISEKEQGRVQGAIYGARALFDSAGAILFGRLYGTMEFSSRLSRTAPYLMSAAIYSIALVVALRLHVPRQPVRPEPPRSRAKSTEDSESDDTAIDVDDGSESHQDDADLLSKPLLGRRARAH